MISSCDINPTSQYVSGNPPFEPDHIFAGGGEKNWQTPLTFSGNQAIIKENTLPDEEHICT
jgi:hypothetical protein